MSSPVTLGLVGHRNNACNSFIYQLEGRVQTEQRPSPLGEHVCGFETFRLRCVKGNVRQNFMGTLHITNNAELEEVTGVVYYVLGLKAIWTLSSICNFDLNLQKLLEVF